MISGFSTPYKERTCKVWKCANVEQTCMCLIGIDLEKKKSVCKVKIPSFGKEQSIYYSPQEELYIEVSQNTRQCCHFHHVTRN